MSHLEERRKKNASRLLKMDKELDFVEKIKTHYRPYLERIFNSEGKLEGDELESHLHDKTRQTIDGMGIHYATMGMRTISGPITYQSPQCKLGWTNFIKMGEGNSPYIESPTIKGKEIYDKLRKIRGQEPAKKRSLFSR